MFMDLDNGVTSVKTIRGKGLNTFTGVILLVDLTLSPERYSECKNILSYLSNANCKYYTIDYSDALAKDRNFLFELNVNRLPCLIVMQAGLTVSQFSLPISNIQKVLHEAGINS
ncbi:hypothetical protein MUB24_13630 [Lederbergia sp. NSJ-179]|uniref:hypothetical protein n=1 Tax=Lederbergia sp. NSJ-179 TaxID=2931402 RepID=UPI001FD040F1|nr:hypothetical protein [Lederbergia sp. NSJ-179]MCJ7841920.1 hypothetical protein [Lederbergia sp. NSJ-179]